MRSDPARHALEQALHDRETDEAYSSRRSPSAVSLRALLLTEPPEKDRGDSPLWPSQTTLAAAVRSALEEFRHERISLDAKMLRHVSEDAREGSESHARMIGDRDVVLAALLRCKPHVTSGLARNLVPVTA